MDEYPIKLLLDTALELESGQRVGEDWLWLVTTPAGVTYKPTNAQARAALGGFEFATRVPTEAEADRRAETAIWWATLTNGNQVLFQREGNVWKERVRFATGAAATPELSTPAAPKITLQSDDLNAIGFDPLGLPATDYEYTIKTESGENFTGRATGTTILVGPRDIPVGGFQLYAAAIPGVRNRGDVATNTVPFTATPPVPAPVVAAISSTSAQVGATVTLTGINLAGATTVSFNGTAQQTITNNTGASLAVVVPVGATSGGVTVTTPGGTSGPVAFTVAAPATVPGKVVGLNATAGNAQAVLNWAVPADGGSAITGYRVYVNDALVATVATSTYTATGLTNGTAYTFAVMARNAVGNGTISDPATATPVAPNQLPVVTSFTASATELDAGQTLTFTAAATDADGVVQSIRIYDGSTLAATITGASGTQPITPQPGTRTYSAKAYDGTAEGNAFGVTRTVTVYPAYSHTLTGPSESDISGNTLTTDGEADVLAYSLIGSPGNTDPKRMDFIDETGVVSVVDFPASYLGQGFKYTRLGVVTRGVFTDGMVPLNN